MRKGDVQRSQKDYNESLHSSIKDYANALRAADNTTMLDPKDWQTNERMVGEI